MHVDSNKYKKTVRALQQRLSGRVNSTQSCPKRNRSTVYKFYGLVDKAVSGANSGDLGHAVQTKLVTQNPDINGLTDRFGIQQSNHHIRVINEQCLFIFVDNKILIASFDEQQ
jgi:hypothetical protein